MSRNANLFLQQLTFVVLIIAAVPVCAPAQPPGDSRSQLQAMRRDYGRATDAFQQFDQQLKAKNYDAAQETLKELVALKGKLEGAKLPSVIQRTVQGWNRKLQDNAKALEAAGVKLPEALHALTEVAPSAKPNPGGGNKPRRPSDSRFDISGAMGVVDDGRRQLADFEADVWGPLPFPELVLQFVRDEVELLLERQNEDGSFAMLNRKTEAGGTVECVIMASMCGYSLRNHVELDRERIEKAIAGALDYVLYMVRSGKLRTNVTDAAWRYIYAMRFLVHEYPHVKDEKTKALIEDACRLLLYELADMQQWLPIEKSKPVQWRMYSPPGMYVEDDVATGLARVTECPEDSIAHKAGIRVGDLVMAANGKPVKTTLRYFIAQMSWRGGDAVELAVLRDGASKTFKLELPHRFPGRLGIVYQDADGGGVAITDFEKLGNPDQASIKVGDHVVSVDGKAVSSAKDVDQLVVYSGQQVKLEIQRGDERKVVDLTCVPIPVADLGCDIAGNTDFSTIDGLAIGKLRGGSSLGAAGLKAGDRILRIDNTRILNRRHFRDIQYALWGGKTISVTYVNSSGQQKTTVEATAGSRLHDQWLGEGQHGLELGASRNGKGVVVKSVALGSPSEKAGCKEGDIVVKVNGVSVAELRLNDAQLLVDVMSGVRCDLMVSRNGESVDLGWTANRPNDSAWFAGKPEKRGGWVYYKNVRGGTTFMTSDLLRTLVRAHNSDIPLDIPPQVISGPFSVISKLRKKQPNSNVESYRYDAGGSFWNVQDIRGDVGRLNAAELACVMYCDAGLPHDDDVKRTQANLAATLREWIKHRGIMDYQKTGLHGKFSIAPYYFPYSYLTTLEAADYFIKDDALKVEVQKTAVKAYMTYVRIEFFESLDRDSWLIGYYPRPQLLRTCLLLDGLSLVKRLYRPLIEVQHAELRDALAKFNLRQYGEAYQLLQAVVDAKSSNADLVAEAKKLQSVIDARYAQRLEEIKEIHKKFYRDAIRYLEETKPHFKGHPRSAEIDDMLADWKGAALKG